jgi:hypothetical protein
MNTTDLHFINREAAFHFVEEMKDPEAQAFVRYGITTILIKRRIPETALPAAPLDLMYLCLVFEAMYANKGAINMILQGRADELSLFGD